MATTISMDQFRKRFDVHPGQQVGNGHFSQVFAAIDKFAKTEVSLKMVQPNGDPRLRPSGKLLSKLEKLSHPNLLRYHEHLIVEPDTAPNGEKGFELFVSEHISGGDLQSLLLKPITENDGKRIISDMILGLEALHSEGIGHGNLKPSNVLIQFLPEPHVRLADYGLVEGQSYRDAVIKYPPGSIAYLAPEQLLGNPVRPNADFWSLGMIVYELFRGQYAFGANLPSNSDYAARIKSADLPTDLHQIPSPYRKLIEACLIRNPDQRPQKISTLKRILAGESTWENGKEVMKQNQVLPKLIECHSCRTKNREGEVTCQNCGKALIGPAFLKDYRSNNAFAIWTLIFFGFVMLPIGFFYYGLYKTSDTGAHDIDIVQKVKKVAEFYNAHIKPDNSRDQEEAAKQIAVIVGSLIGAYYSIFGSLWSLFQLLWMWRASNNLERLGSHGRSYHPALSLLGVFAVVAGSVGALIFPPLIILIPVSAIFRLLTLQEVWRGSNPAFLVQGVSWKSNKGSFLITSWWILSMIFPVLLILPLIPTTLDFVIQIEWFYITIAILVAYCVLYAMVLIRVNYRQASKYLGWARQGGIVSRKP